MFSGIIDAIGRVQASRTVKGGRTLVIRAPGYWADVPTGGSIAVDGVCLTLTSSDRDDAEFDVIAALHGPGRLYPANRGATRLISRFALPWADMLLPLRGDACHPHRLRG